MLGMEIVVQKDCVVVICAEHLLGPFNANGNVNLVAFETRGKPTMPAPVVIQQKNADRVSLSLYPAEAQFTQ